METGAGRRCCVMWCVSDALDLLRPVSKHGPRRLTCGQVFGCSNPPVLCTSQGEEAQSRTLERNCGETAENPVGASGGVERSAEAHSKQVQN